MVKSSKADLVKNVLSNGPKRAKHITQAFEEEGISESDAFYWLKKLRERGEIRKEGPKYKLTTLEKADDEELSFLLKKLENGDSAVKKAAAEDLRTICSEKKVSHLDHIWNYIDRALENSFDQKIREKAIQSLRSIAINSAMIKEDKVIEKIREDFREKLKRTVMDDDLSFSAREIAAEILNIVLEGKENFQTQWSILSELLESEEQMSVGLTIWRRLLDEHFDDKSMKIREKLYSLLENGDKSVRESVMLFFDELRARERKFA